jgi:hypothetical protein
MIFERWMNREAKFNLVVTHQTEGGYAYSIYQTLN